MSDCRDVITFYVINMFQNLCKEVVEDCDAAIQRDGKYQKAFARRARAHLKLGNTEQALSGKLHHQMLADQLNVGFRILNNLLVVQMLLMVITSKIKRVKQSQSYFMRQLIREVES